MENKNVELTLEFEQVLALVKQLPKNKIKEIKQVLSNKTPEIITSSTDGLNEAEVKQLATDIQSDFESKLGKFTYKKISDSRFIRGMSFNCGDMGFVFSINISFTKNIDENLYNQLGMNLIIKTNGKNNSLRNKFIQFFETNLKNWQNQKKQHKSLPEPNISSLEIGRYKKIADFNNEQEMKEFLQKSIDGIHKLYPLIREDKEKIFAEVVRSASPMGTKLIDICHTKMVL